MFSFKCLPEGQKMFKDNLIINSKIEKGKRIGNGQFGEVFKGNENYHNFYQIIFTIVLSCAASTIYSVFIREL